MLKTTGYEPLYTLKNIAPNVWIADGGWISFYGLPFPTRMTVIRLNNGDIWIHSPIEDKNGIANSVAGLGPVRHLIAPNWIHYAWMTTWQLEFPKALTWVSPGVVKRAASKGIFLHYDHELDDNAPIEWSAQIEQRLANSGYHQEVIFFHRASKTLVLTDLIENFEADKMPWWTRPLLKLGRVCDPNGQMPVDMAISFRRHPQHLKNLVDTMLEWNPDRVIISHGRWYPCNGTDEIHRAFHWLK